MFYEEAKINNVLNCVKCSQKLDEPRILVCGESICAYCHISIEVNNSNKFKCFLCKKDHSMPEEGLPINKKLLEILSLESKEVYRGEKVKKLKEHLTDFQADIAKFSFGINNGVDRIKEHCLELKNRVQLQTEEAIEQLNEHNKQMIKEIEEFEIDCIKFYRANEKKGLSFSEFQQNKQELEEFNLKWNEYLKQSIIADEKISDAIAKAKELSINAKQDLIKLEKIIFNGGEMKFEKNENKLDKSILGLLVKPQLIDDSVILSNQQMLELMNLCKLPLNLKWSLIYRATRDGFGAADFHSKCDTSCNSLVIIRAKNGNVFGGYTERSWFNNQLQQSVYKADFNAFLFSFINQYKTKLVMKCTDPSFAICTNNQYGPTFGKDKVDLFIFSDSDKTNQSYSNLGGIYKHPDYAYESNEARSFLAGSYKFQTSEIEIYTKDE